MTQSLFSWSYGVFLWEMYSCGAVPYQGIQSDDMLAYLQNGHRLERMDGIENDMLEDF
jgi:hypothetical protein